MGPLAKRLLAPLIGLVMYTVGPPATIFGLIDNNMGTALTGIVLASLGLLLVTIHMFKPFPLQAFLAMFIVLPGALGWLVLQEAPLLGLSVAMTALYFAAALHAVSTTLQSLQQHAPKRTKID